MPGLVTPIGADDLARASPGYGGPALLVKRKQCSVLRLVWELGRVAAVETVLIDLAGGTDEFSSTAASNR